MKYRKQSLCSYHSTGRILVYILAILTVVFLIFILKWFSSFKAEYRLAVSLTDSCPYLIAEEDYCAAAVKAASDKNIACTHLGHLCPCSCCEEPASCSDSSCATESKDCPCSCAAKPCTNEDSHAEWCKVEDLQFCDAWANEGGCQSRPDFMLDCCRESCGLCEDSNSLMRTTDDVVLLVQGAKSLQGTNYLSVPQPFWILDEQGMYDISFRYSHLSVDVGYNRGHISAKWMEEQSSLFIIALEANPQLYAYHKVLQWDVDTEGQSFASQTCPNLTEVDSKEGKREHLRNYNLFAVRNAKKIGKQLMLINAAAGSLDEKGIAEFFLRKSDTTGDSGTVRKFRDQIRQITLVLPLKNILNKVPVRMIYDTLKVDALGSELQVLEGVGNQIMKFKCVIGEFGTIPREPGTEQSKAFLKEYGFVSVPPYLWGEGADDTSDKHKDSEYERRIYSVDRFDNRFFINTAFAENFLRGEGYWCRVADVTRKRYDKRQLKFRAQWWKDRGY